MRIIADATFCLTQTCRAGESNPPAETPPEFDLPRIERAVRETLLAIGENPDRDGLLDTPKRVARAYRELFRALRENPAHHLQRTFRQDHEELVLVRDIGVTSICEHHLLPFFGVAHIAYLPARGRVVGLSKIARTVDVFARRPQVQERLTDQIADALVEHLQPRGVAVIIRAKHLCMTMRGASKHGARMVTRALRGMFRTDRALAAEVLSLVGKI